jgi:hypothetical protein
MERVGQINALEQALGEGSGEEVGIASSIV